MKIVFASNFYNHHQSPFSAAMDRHTNGNYSFIETMPMDDERRNLGWGGENYPPYIKRIYDSDETQRECQNLIDNADVVIIGSAPDSLIKKRLRQKKLTFRYSERIYKQGAKWYELPARTLLYYFRHGMHENLYMLCASAYTAADYAKTATFLNKTYKWGYFPEMRQYENIDLMLNRKKAGSILWAGRLIDWKHPEVPIKIAQRLKEEGYTFDLNIIGNGHMEKYLQQMVQQYNLQEYVHLLGAMPPDNVRQHMEKSKIFLFTSDFNEGWGAVLNEAMNSGCAVVASHAIGSVPFLIDNNENGLIYQNGDIDSVYTKVKFLLENPNTQKEIGLRAYRTITEQWNADIAAERFLVLAQSALSGKPMKIYQKHICSEAEILRNDWL